MAVVVTAHFRNSEYLLECFGCPLIRKKPRSRFILCKEIQVSLMTCIYQLVADIFVDDIRLAELNDFILACII